MDLDCAEFLFINAPAMWNIQMKIISARMASGNVWKNTDL